MNEEEANMWFEDSKEQLVKDYLKKMDSLLLETDDEEKKQSLTPEQAKKLMYDYEKEFLKRSNEIRDKYDSYVDKARKKEKSKIENKKRLEKILSPFAWAWSKLKDAFTFLSKKMTEGKQISGQFYFDHIGKQRLRAKERTKMRIESKLFPYKLFYTQNIWPILHYLNTPNRKFRLFMAKQWESFKQHFKKIFGKILNKAKKILKYVWEKIKAVLGIFKKTYQAITKAYKATIEYAKKVVEVIKLRWFREEEE